MKQLLIKFRQWWCRHEEVDLINIYYSDRHVHMKCRACKKEVNAYF